MVKKPLYTVAAIIVFIALWWLVAVAADSMLLPTPWQTVRAAADVLSSHYSWQHIGVTFYRVFLGGVIGSVAGALMGIATRYNRLAETAVRSVIYPLFQSVPIIIWPMIFVIWFGLGSAAPVLTIAVAVAPFFIINIWEGIKEMDANLVEMATTYTHRKDRILGKVILPMLYPYLFTALRGSSITAWRVVILGEIFGSASGIGYLLWMAFENYRIDEVFAWTFIFAAIIITFDYGIYNYIDRKYIRRWKYQQEKS